MPGLLLHSWETVMRRTLLIAQNDCLPAEYRRMVKEKAEAGRAFGIGSDLQRRKSAGVFAASVLAPPGEGQCKASAKKVDMDKIRSGAAGIIDVGQDRT